MSEWDGKDRRKSEVIKISTWMIPIIISVLVGSTSNLMSFGAFKENVSNLDKRISMLESDNNRYKERILVLETTMPVLQRDISDIKSDLKELKADVKKVLIAIK